jgi:hypothetical protein
MASGPHYLLEIRINNIYNLDQGNNRDIPFNAYKLLWATARQNLAPTCEGWQ